MRFQSPVTRTRNTSKKVFIKGNKIPNKTKQEYEIQLADHLALGFNSTEPKLAEVLDTGLS